MNSKKSKNKINIKAVVVEAKFILIQIITGFDL